MSDDVIDPQLVCIGCRRPISIRTAPPICSDCVNGTSTPDCFCYSTPGDPDPDPQCPWHGQPAS